MANFEPLTTIYLCNTGIDDENKPYFESNMSMGTWVISKAVLSFTNYSYQRGDERQYCAVDAPYDECIKCDTICYNNDNTFWVIGNITGCEFKNPNCTWVYFEIDPFCTFCGDIDWDHSYSMVEREHVAQDWNGVVPNWTELGVGEPITGEATTIFGPILEPDIGGTTLVLISPYGYDGEPNVTGKINHGMFDSLRQVVSTDAAGINTYLMQGLTNGRLSVTDIVGIYSVPSKVLEMDGNSVQYGQIQTPWAQNTNNLNNAKCYCGQFFVMKIESMVGSSVSYSPELLPNNPSITIMINGVFAAGKGGMTCYPMNYAGGDGEKYASTIKDFPMSAWVGDAYAEWATSNTMNDAVNLITGVFGGVMTMKEEPEAGAVQAGSAIGRVIGTHQNRQKGSATVNGQVASSGQVYALATSNYNFKVSFYGPTVNELKSIDSFFDVFGYKVMRLKVPERNTRPCWNYVKTVDGHIHCTAPITYVRRIEDMLNNGVTFWNVGAREIGDYSNPAANKA